MFVAISNMFIVALQLEWRADYENTQQVSNSFWWLFLTLHCTKNRFKLSIIITIELNLFWTTGSQCHVLRDPDRATNCNRGVMSSEHLAIEPSCGRDNNANRGSKKDKESKHTISICSPFLFVIGRIVVTWYDTFITIGRSVRTQDHGAHGCPSFRINLIPLL